MIIKSSRARSKVNHPSFEEEVKQPVIIEEAKVNTKKKNKKAISAPVEEIPVVEEVKTEDIDLLSEWLKEDIDE